MTLTLIQHIDNIIVNMYTKFEFNPTNGSWFTARTKFSTNHEFDLDLWPNDLDLVPNSSPHWCLPSHQFWFQSNSWYIRYWLKRSFVTHGRTDQPTKQFIEMRRSRWTHLKIANSPITMSLSVQRGLVYLKESVSRKSRNVKITSRLHTVMLEYQLYLVEINWKEI